MLALLALALPVLHVLLAVDLVLLAATVATALRLLTRVRITTRVAAEDEPQEDGENFEPEPEPLTRPSFTLIPPQPPQQPPPQPRSRPPAAEQTLLPLSGAIEPTRPHYEEPQVPGSPVQFFEETALGGIVADPIDGAPFHAGETILVCRCGAGYHQETGAWLREHLAGKCVHCGVAHTLEPRLLEPRSQSALRH